MTDEITAAARLRTFEDEMFGRQVVRINGRIERGSGSPYSRMNPEQRALYAAYENLVDADQKLTDAHAALIAAQFGYDVAETNIETAAEQIKTAADEKAKADADAAIDAMADKPPIVT